MEGCIRLTMQEIALGFFIGSRIVRTFRIDACPEAAFRDAPICRIRHPRPARVGTFLLVPTRVLTASNASFVSALPSGDHPIAAGFIHMVSQMWPSGSSKLRPYMKPKS
jgi:hypothetical protein